MAQPRQKLYFFPDRQCREHVCIQALEKKCKDFQDRISEVRHGVNGGRKLLNC